MRKVQNWALDFPGGPVVKAQWFDSWSRKIPHALEQLSLCATATEAQAPRACALSKRSHRSEKPAHCNWSQPRLPVVNAQHSQN